MREQIADWLPVNAGMQGCYARDAAIDLADEYVDGLPRRDSHVVVLEVLQREEDEFVAWDSGGSGH